MPIKKNPPLLWEVINSKSQYYGMKGFLIIYPITDNGLITIGNIQGPTTYGKKWEADGMPHPAQAKAFKLSSVKPITLRQLSAEERTLLKKRLKTLWAVHSRYPCQLYKRL